MTQARRRLEAAGIPDAALEAELLLRHSIGQTATQPELLGDRPSADAASDHPEPAEGESSYQADASSDNPEAGEGQSSHPVDAPTHHPELVEGRAPAPGVSRAYLFSHLEDSLDADKDARYIALLQRRLDREPSAYILGHREFFGLDFLVTPDVLIPRPETETLVENAISLVKTRGGQLTIADIGTGSGAIAVALATSLPRAVIYATDVSHAALAVAGANARCHGVGSRISFSHGDLLAPVSQLCNLIVANLPYVAATDLPGLEPEVRDHEPRLALAAGNDGLDLIRRLLLQAPPLLAEHATICLEFGAGQAAAIQKLASEGFPNAAIQVLNDLADLPRIVTIQT